MELALQNHVWSGFLDLTSSASGQSVSASESGFLDLVWDGLLFVSEPWKDFTRIPDFTMYYILSIMYYILYIIL